MLVGEKVGWPPVGSMKRPTASVSELLVADTTVSEGVPGCVPLTYTTLQRTHAHSHRQQPT